MSIQDAPSENPFTPAELAATVAALILGFVLQDAIFFHQTRDWERALAVTEAVTIKGESWIEEGAQRHQSWKEGTYLYKVGDSVFRGFRFELVSSISNRKPPLKFVPKGTELPGSTINVYVDPSVRYGSYFHEGNSKWVKAAYYASWVSAGVLILCLLLTLSAGLKSFMGTLLASLLVFGGAFAFTYDADRVLEPDERLETPELYDLFLQTGQTGYMAPKPTDFKSLKEGMTLTEAAEVVGRPTFLNINSNRIWWGYYAQGRTVQPSLVFEEREGEYRLTTITY